MKERALRSTPQRRLILDILQQIPDHPTAETVYARAAARRPKISLGTVYRNLALLCELGQIRRIPVPGGPDHFDECCREHCHFLCTACGEMCDVPAECAPLSEHLSLSSMPGFSISGRFLVYTGLCPTCQKKGRILHE